MYKYVGIILNGELKKKVNIDFFFLRGYEK